MNILRKSLYSFVDDICFAIDRQRDYYRDKHFISELDLPVLTKWERAEIKRIWPCFKFRDIDFIWMRIYKAEHGFDPYYLCDHQYAKLLRIVNNRIRIKSLVNKALYDIYMPHIPWPKVYLRRINGYYYDHEMKLINNVIEAIEILHQYNKFVIKAATDSGGGRGVQQINLEQEQVDLQALLLAYKGDIVVQAIIDQCDELKCFNPTSVNTCRITTIFMGNKSSYSAIFKVGRKNSKIDNWNSSFLLGVKENGSLTDFGYDVNLKKVYKSDVGIEFHGKLIPQFEEMVHLTQKYHAFYFPGTAIVGWDITVQKDGTPVVIEANLDFPGILGEQLCSGTFFKVFRDEICTIMTGNKKKFS